jgi:hypothetical protein
MAHVTLSSGVRRSLLGRWLNMARPGQVLSSLFAVLAAYWLYALLFVPLIEPNVDHEVATRATDEEIREARQAAGALGQELAKYFPPGSWELDNPAIFESDQTLFLFKSPEPLPGGLLKLRWCTLISLPKPAAPGATPMQPVIMRASEGATLQFDQPIKLENLDLNKRQLEGGSLQGEITIRRLASRADGSDALLVTTRDMKLEGSRAWTPHPVQFQMGASHGSGRELVIHLSGDPKAAAKNFRAGGLKTLELLREVVMHLDLGAGSSPAPPGKPTNPSAAGAQIKITCRGPFQYDFARYTASFHEKVDVVRHTDGPADVLNCEVLSVLFAHDNAKDPTAAVKPGIPNEPRADGMQDAQVRAVEARGDPVILRSPSRGLDIRCQALHFQPAPGGATGRIVAAGPGSMQGDLPKGGVGKYLVEWMREFRFEPDGAGELASLHGGASVRFGAMGKIRANNRTDAQGNVVEEGQLYAWLTAPARPVAGQTAPPANDAWQVDRVMAKGDVVIDSPQLAGATGKLEAWIERPKAVAKQGPNEDATEAQPKAKAASNPNATSRFAVRSGAIQIKLLAEGEQLTVADASLENQARLEQTSALKPGEKPLVVQGDRLHVLGANTLQTRVTVTGKPALLEAGGITLRGPAIEMEKQTSHLWVDGPGRMTMPMEQDLNGHALAKAEPVDIAWRGRMNFQDKVVVYERGVEVKTPSQVLATEKLEATLSRPIDFSNAGAAATPTRDKPADQPQLVLVQSFGPTFLQSRQFDERGRQTSFDVTNVYDLRIDRVTGAVDARGPGVLTHVGFNTAQNGPNAPALPGAARPVAQVHGEPELVYLNVQFARALSGNLHQRVVTFSEPTKTVYGPVNDWGDKLNPEEPSKLGPNAIVLDARELTVRETPSRTPREPASYELVAKGNVTTEGSQFVARGQLATYSQQKDQLVLEGEGPSPAEISYDNPQTGRRNVQSSAIVYSIKLQHVRLIGAQSVGVDVLQNKPAGAPKKKLPF